MNKEYKYYIAAGISPENARVLESCRAYVLSHLGMRASGNELPVHVTLHRPFTGVEPRRIADIVKARSLMVERTRMRYTGIDHFGTSYVVLPIIATLAAASLWVGLHAGLRSLPGYEHGAFDGDNTLHVSLASKVDEQSFQRGWSAIKKIAIVPADLSLTHIVVYRALNEPGAAWHPIQVSELARA